MHTYIHTHIYMHIYITIKIVISLCENYICVEEFCFSLVIVAEQFPWTSDPIAS